MWKRSSDRAASVSVPRVPRRPGEWNDVADIRQSRRVRYRPLEAQTESRVRDGAVPPQVAIPGVMILVQLGFGHACVEHVEPFLALAAADDLADPGCKHVHRRDGPAVVV